MFCGRIVITFPRHRTTAWGVQQILLTRTLPPPLHLHLMVFLVLFLRVWLPSCLYSGRLRSVVYTFEMQILIKIRVTRTKKKQEGRKRDRLLLKDKRFYKLLTSSRWFSPLSMSRASAPPFHRQCIIFLSQLLLSFLVLFCSVVTLGEFSGVE